VAQHQFATTGSKIRRSSARSEKARSRRRDTRALYSEPRGSARQKTYKGEENGFETTRKTALITGASKGLGYASAEVLAQEGCSLRLVSRSEADPDAIHDARMLASEIGWLETSLPAVAARAVRAVEALLDVGLTERSEQIHHQLLVFEAFEQGLLATWETPEELFCLSIQPLA
jgi:hypothetical protein